MLAVLLNAEIALALSDVGMCYLGIMSDAKSYLYRYICQTTLMYGLDAINLSAPVLTKLQNTQGSIMKRVCGIQKRSHHTRLLRAIDIPDVSRLEASYRNQYPHYILVFLISTVHYEHVNVLHHLIVYFIT